MNEAFYDTLIILAVGMITVFFILALVVFTGQLLIRLTNRLAEKAAIVETSQTLANTPTPLSISRQRQQVSKKKMAVLIAAVAAVTDGKGRIEKIERI